jgi:transposase
MDETSISYFMSPEYSRCQLGHRCVLKTSDNKVFQKLTLVAAICSSGIVSYTLYDQGGMTTDRLIEFLEKVLKNKKDYLVVMDNAPAHRKEIVRSTIEKTGNNLVYCVPYSPRSNAIESWFSQLKHYMKLDKTLNIEQVRQSITTALIKIKPENYLHHFQYAYQKDDLKKFERKKSTFFRKPKVYKL